MRLHVALVITLVAVVAGPLLGAPAGAAPSIAVTPSKIVVSGITPGAQVLFFGAGFEPKRTYAILHEWKSVVPDDGHGNAVFPLDPPVNWNALWIVADLRNGHYGIAATPGFPIDRERLTRHEFKRDLNAQVTRFLYSRTNVDFLYLEPGGAWTFTAADGTSTDLDGTTDGALLADLLHFQPVGGSQPPHAFTPGGTLLAIDTSRLDLLEVKIDGSMLAGAQ